MSETLTIFGIDYPNTEGFKVKDDLGTTHTYGEGGGTSADIPVFELVFDDDYEEIISSSCNKTLAECYEIYNNQTRSGTVTISNESGTEEESFPVCAWRLGANESYITYIIYSPYANGDITYYSYGEIEFVYPSEIAKDSSDLTVSGNTVTAPAGSYALDAYITVPSGEANLQSKSVSYTPSETAQSQTITADSGYDGLDEVSVSVGAISSTYVGTSIARKSSSDLNVSGATVTAPAGYYESAATKTVASGTEGTPTATKGTVSNHAVSVTPSVTNSAGYISGGTKTGTSVSVSASELVSGTLTISSSGTKDVTNYASASVAAGTEGTPTATKGTVSNHSVSVTPSVTNTGGYISGGTKTGTAVTVSASELVSGSETKTANGTYDVTNLASLVVAVPIVTYYTGSSVPSSSLGSNGDIYLQTN